MIPLLQWPAFFHRKRVMRSKMLCYLPCRLWRGSNEGRAVVTAEEPTARQPDRPVAAGGPPGPERVLVKNGGAPGLIRGAERGKVVLFVANDDDRQQAAQAASDAHSCLIYQPSGPEQLIVAARRCTTRREPPAAYRSDSSQISRNRARDLIIGGCPAIKELCATIERVAPRRSTLLLRGETGTGKEVAARAIHASSGRKGHFVAGEGCQWIFPPKHVHQPRQASGQLSLLASGCTPFRRRHGLGASEVPLDELFDGFLGLL